MKSNRIPILRRLPIGILALLFSCLAEPLTLAAQAKPEGHTQDSGTPLQVGIHTFSPFVDAGAQPKGFDIDLWQQIASRLNRPYKLTSYPTVDDLLAAVKQGEVDAALGGITINSKREQTVDFTHGYYRSGLGILVPYHEQNLGINLLESFFNRTIALTLLSFVGFITLAGLIYWLLERSTSKDRKRPSLGIGDGMWLSYTTATTIGYGDMAPKSLLGRLATIPISLIGFIVIGSLSGVIASQMTIKNLRSNILSLHDLAGKRVAVKTDTATIHAISGYSLKLIQVDTNEEAYQLVKSGAVEAFVHDAPALKHHVNREGAGSFTVVEQVFEIRHYGIALPETSKLREDINRALLEFFETDDGALAQRYGI